MSNTDPSADDKTKEKIVNPSTYILAGFSQLPANATFYFGSSTLAVEVEIDPYDERIVDAACNFLPDIGRKFLIRLLIGNHIENGIKNAMEKIRSRYFSITQRALIAALEDILMRYNDLKHKKGKI